MWFWHTRCSQSFWVIYLKEYVGKVVEGESETADAREVAYPGETEQDYRDDVVCEHLPEVLALDVEEMG